MSAYTRSESERRIAGLQQLMKDAGLDGCLVTQNVGIYYLAGSMQTGYLFVPAKGPAAYYVKRSLKRAEDESHVRVVELGSLRRFGGQLEGDYPALFAGNGSAGRPQIGADLDVMPAQQYLRFVEAVPQADWRDASALLRRQRSVKSEYEIGRIEAAARVAAASLEEGLRSLREGMTELELMTVIERKMREAGHIGLMRMRGYNQEIAAGMVAAGESAAVPTYFDGPAGGAGLTPAFPQSSSLRPIRRGEPILLDIGCCIDGYVIDQTRTAAIGRLPDELRRAYGTADAILRRTEASLKPGAVPEALYVQALSMAEDAGLSEHFMGFGRDQVKFLGHGIGLEIDEWPVLARGFTEPLEPGMVIAVEPKFTFPGAGVVGIENTYLLTENGCRALTLSPETLYEMPLDHP
ncbi:M24 family metallopeptidase [Cohnella caldifontis]|uniref:M24 family metallopeptidase n=1 Tax=Cohnella caldifontis TaxID=3027471 RepID=UPI0023EBD97F|nr:Xaa-Pro peptidase family protein [Cohnella sp. YIM B05605]